MKICKWCNKELDRVEITYPHNECDNCWQMRHRMEHDVVLANKILKSLILQGAQ